MPTSIKLKGSVVDILKKDQELRTKLALELRKSYPTIQRYVEDNSVMLTTAKSLKVISDETGIEKEALIEEVCE